MKDLNAEFITVHMLPPKWIHQPKWIEIANTFYIPEITILKLSTTRTP